MAAFLTPASPTPAISSAQPPAMQDKQAGQTQPPPMPEKISPQVPEQQQTSAYVPGATMPAFGEPTISGLPFGQSPDTKSTNKEQPDLPADERNASAKIVGANQTQPQETTTSSGSVTKNGEAAY